MFLVTLSLKLSAKENIFIIYNINNKIVTNIDVLKESKYLLALNNQLNSLNKKQILKIARESILREEIKKIELIKYFNLSEENKIIDDYIKNYYTKLKLNNEKEFINYLSNYDLTLSYVKKKIQIEMAWNQFIYEKYKNQVNIDITKLQNEIKKKNNNNKGNLTYLLSEIIFEKNAKEDLNKKINDIIKSIDKIGFKNTATIYSESDSSKFGGNIGWIEEGKLSNKILKEIIDLKISEYTSPIQLGSSFLILKVEEKKYEKKIIDEKQKLDEKIQYETSRQLDQFSKMYYHKIKINMNIDEH